MPRWEDSSRPAMLSGRLRGLESVFFEAAARHNIDPYLLMAISMAETGGSSHQLRVQNNPGGLANPRGRGYQSFSNINAGIEAMAAHLSTSRYRGKSIDQIGQIYAPTGAANDPHGTNPQWPGMVRRYYQQFSGRNPTAVSNTQRNAARFSGDPIRQNTREILDIMSQMMSRNTAPGAEAPLHGEPSEISAPEATITPAAQASIATPPEVMPAMVEGQTAPTISEVPSPTFGEAATSEVMPAMTEGQAAPIISEVPSPTFGEAAMSSEPGTSWIAYSQPLPGVGSELVPTQTPEASQIIDQAISFPSENQATPLQDQAVPDSGIPDFMAPLESPTPIPWDEAIIASSGSSLASQAQEPGQYMPGDFSPFTPSSPVDYTVPPPSDLSGLDLAPSMSASDALWGPNVVQPQDLTGDFGNANALDAILSPTDQGGVPGSGSFDLATVGDSSPTFGEAAVSTDTGGAAAPAEGQAAVTDQTPVQPTAFFDSATGEFTGGPGVTPSGAWWGSGGTNTFYPQQTGFQVLPGGQVQGNFGGGPNPMSNILANESMKHAIKFGPVSAGDYGAAMAYQPALPGTENQSYQQYVQGVQAIQNLGLTIGPNGWVSGMGGGQEAAAGPPMGQQGQIQHGGVQ